MNHLYYTFAPSDTVFVLDNETNSIVSGEVLQLAVDGAANVERQEYLVLVGDGTIKVSPDFVFSTFEDATYILSLKINSETDLSCIGYEPDIHFKLNDPTTVVFEDTQNNSFASVSSSSVPIDADTIYFNVAGPNGSLNATEFNDAYLSFPYSQYMKKNMDGAFSAFCWAKPNVLGTMTFISAFYAVSGLDDNYSIFNLVSNGGSLTSLIRDRNGAEMFATSATNILTTDWQHVGVTYDGAGTLTLFHNAVSVVVSTSLTAIGINDPTHMLGNIANRGDLAIPYNGAMSDVKIWSYEINNKQILDEYNNALSI